MMSDHHDPADEAEGAGQTAGPPSFDTPSQPCRHLRSNGIYLDSDGSQSLDPSHESYSSSACWCIKTMTGFGPDDERVSRLDCVNTARSCYVPLY